MRRHSVILFAAEGSLFDHGELVEVPIGDYGNEVKLLSAMAAHPVKPDVIIDHTHSKVVSYFYPHFPVVSVYHDMWMRPYGKNPVLVSHGMKALPGMDWAIDAPVIHHVVDPKDYPFCATPTEPRFVLYCGIMREYKNPVLAIEAAALAGLPLVMIGIQTGMPIFGRYGRTKFVGAHTGALKAELFGNAAVYLQLGDHEAFGLTTVEAGLCGTPAVGLMRGGTVDIIQYTDGCVPLNGVFVQAARNLSQSVADSIHAAMELDRGQVRKAAATFTDVGDYVLQWEKQLESVI
jgi:glycosyltransferase involved in cell wall biosynthesis